MTPFHDGENISNKDKFRAARITWWSKVHTALPEDPSSPSGPMSSGSQPPLPSASGALTLSSGLARRTYMQIKVLAIYINNHIYAYVHTFIFIYAYIFEKQS